jgi:hypothetical protein
LFILSYFDSRLRGQSIFSSDLVTIHVGKGDGKNRTFVIHRNVLAKSPLFDRILNKYSLVGKDKDKDGANFLALALPDDDPDVFELFCLWLYGKNLSSIATAKDNLSSNHFNVNSNVNINFSNHRTLLPLLLKLCHFAEKNDLPDLLGHSIDAFLSACGTNNCIPSVAQAVDIYKSSSGDSKLRLLAVHTLVFTLLGLGADMRDQRWSNAAFVAALGANEDLLMDVVKMLRGMLPFEVTEPLDPRDLPPCFFHQHAKEEECPYGGGSAPERETSESRKRVSFMSGV